MQQYLPSVVRFSQDERDSYVPPSVESSRPHMQIMPLVSTFCQIACSSIEHHPGSGALFPAIQHFEVVQLSATRDGAETAHSACALLQDYIVLLPSLPTPDSAFFSNGLFMGGGGQQLAVQLMWLLFVMFWSLLFTVPVCLVLMVLEGHSCTGVPALVMASVVPQLPVRWKAMRCSRGKLWWCCWFCCGWGCLR